MRNSMCIAAVIACAGITAAEPVSYQGVLNENGAPADGMYDMVFTLADQEVGGLALQSVVLNDVEVSGGLFEVELDFDSTHFDGSPRWLAQRVDGTILSPRTPFQYTPYAMRSLISEDLETPWFKDVDTRVLDVHSSFDTAGVIETGSGPASLQARNDSTGATVDLTTRENVGVDADASTTVGQGTGVLGRGGRSGVIGVAEASPLQISGDLLVRTGVSGQALAVVGARQVEYAGVRGLASNPPASFLIRRDAYGVYGEAIRGGDSFSNAYGIYGTTSGAPQGIAYAGYFQGDVHVNGTLTKSNGAFRIDHPQDPENRFLTHSFVESPEMMNIYNGVVTLDADGQAVVRMPGYFEALNRDFRYQLTPIGAAMPSLHVASEISANEFTIAGGVANARVSWEVTGVRQDPGALARPIVVEQDKPEHLRGKYLDPEAYGVGNDKAIHPRPEQH